MDKHIEDVVTKCGVCNTQKHNNQREPLMSHPIKERAWANVEVDHFHYNDAKYLLFVNYCSKYPEISKLNGKTSKHIIAAREGDGCPTSQPQSQEAKWTLSTLGG
jgi:hypothetical protein